MGYFSASFEPVLLQFQGFLGSKQIASFFRKLNRENLEYNEKLELLMTHPHNNSRIKASLEYETENSFKAQPVDIDWERVKEAL